MEKEERHERGRKGSQSDTGRSSEAPTSPPLKLQLSPALAFFREAVIRDRALQEQLRAAGTCPAVAEIANAYIARSLRIEVSGELEKTPLRGIAAEMFREAFRITVSDLEQHLLYQTNAQGEVLLGESELAMVAGTRVAAETSCYGCSCGATCTIAKTC